MPDGWTDLIDALGQQPGDILVTKHAWSAFSGTGLAGTLREAGVTQVVITGFATSVGVESTARDAHEDGFHVSLPLDAMTDHAPDPHEHSAAHIFPRIAETGTTAELLQLLARHKARGGGDHLLQSCRNLTPPGTASPGSARVPIQERSGLCA
jgi:nicotinamidase-related amidase